MEWDLVLGVRSKVPSPNPQNGSAADNVLRDSLDMLRMDSGRANR